MTTFLNNLNRGTNLTHTENGAVTNKSSLDPVVDFFGLAGAMRNTPGKAVQLFEAAAMADPTTAVRTLFYLRDVRGGQGEREVFRQCMTWLAETFPTTYGKVVQHVPFYGRWDDVLHAGVTPAAVDLISAQVTNDRIALYNGESVSLMAKWLPSENASSQATRELAAQVRTALGCTHREYRKFLSTLRARIRLLEHDMSSNNWDEIDYSKIPSQAHRRHTKAFFRHTEERYRAYLDSVKRGEAKINVSAVYPHEIYTMVQKGDTEYANVAWENLPDYTRGDNALVMADVSGSMVQNYNPANPIAVSVSLALYFAERNTGPFKGYFMTFSSNPQLVKVTGSTLQQRMGNIAKAEWQQNTNLLAAFRAILNAGRHTPEEMPKVLYIISDMQFDAATRGGYDYQIQTHMVPVRTPFGNVVHMPRQIQVPVPPAASDTVFETAKREFAAAGLTLPHVVFWNVQARVTETPALAHDGHVSLVSGLSPTIFAQAVEGKTPRELVDSVVNSDRYQRIVL